MIRRPFIVVILCLAFAGLVACSTPAPTSDGAAQAGSAAPASTPAAPQAGKPIPHACNLLTPKDAEAVLGPGARLVRDSDTTCDLATASALGPTVSIKIEELSDTWDGGDFMISMDKTAQKLPEIGDGGYSYMDGSIVFKKGNAEVSVITSNYKGALSKLDAAKLIATRVAAAM